MQDITISQALPRVFSGEESSARIVQSQVWLTDLTFSRPGLYLVSAESGTGKSSLCSYIYGDRTDYLGTITFDGEDIRSFGIDRWCGIRSRHIAYLAQDMRLFPELTVMENLLVKNRLTDRFSATELHDRLKRLEIDHKADEPAGRLSIGQMQRVAIVRALAQPFDFILLDEPVSHLDSRNNRAAAELIMEAADAQSAAVIATSVGNHLLLDNPVKVPL